MKKTKMPEPDAPLTSAEFSRMKKTYGTAALPASMQKLQPEELLDPTIVAAYRAMGEGWQARMNAVLLAAIQNGEWAPR